MTHRRQANLLPFHPELIHLFVMTTQMMKGEDRALCIRKGSIGRGPVIYWMSRDQRTKDNWALLYAQELARHHNTELHVMLVFTPEPAPPAFRYYRFMIDGLQEIEKNLMELGIPFRVYLPKDTQYRVSPFTGAAAVVTDFSPLRHH
ncbi:MAG: deoxyribodipyrimidine photo-lyase, partial [Spirochaetales bacterium]|nr:deoxyribodipyrimidine photo-lyase [Spirochaetales bacterium]